MDFDALESTWTLRHHIVTPAVTSTFDLHAGANECFLSVLSKLFEPFMRYRVNNI